MSQYTINLEFFGTYTNDNPMLEIWADGVLLSTLSVNQTLGSASLIVSYAGVYPNSLDFVFNDGSSEANREIEIQSLKINDRYVNTGNYLSTQTLLQNDTASLDTTNGNYLFDSDNADPNEFTLGATRTFGAANDFFRSPSSPLPEIFDMGDGRDFAYTGNGDDKIAGGNGEDFLRGGNGDDLISGGNDFDKLYGMDGNDTLYGDAGNDRLFGNEGNDRLYGGQGNDSVFGHEGDDILLGGDGNDSLHGGEGDNILFGDAGNDLLVSVEGNDTLDGGAGNDSFFAGEGDDILNGGAGDDTLRGGNGNNFMDGDEGNDIINGGGDTDIIDDGQGNNMINGGDGIDTAIYHRAWSDYTITLSNSGNAFIIYNIDTRETDIVAQVENFSFIDGDKTDANVVNLKPVITSNGGNETAYISIAENNLAVATIAATDTETPADLIYSISGGVDAGDFNIDATTGDLSFQFLPDYEVPNDANKDNLYNVEVTVTDAGGQTDQQTLSIEVTDVAGMDIGNNVLSSASMNINETIIYDVETIGDRDWFSVNLAGNTDYIIWARGTSTEAGNNTNPEILAIRDALGLQAFAGDDDTGIGTDSFLNFTTGFGGGLHYIDASANNATGTISLSLFEAGNVLSGSGTLTGTVDSDYLQGGFSSDTLNGGNGNDLLDGGAGDDILNGGGGNDVLFGGDGADSFIFTATSTQASIVDYNESDGDILDLSGLITGFDPNKIDDIITDYIQFTDRGANTIMTVDTDGLYNGVEFTQVGTLEGLTGADVQTLYDNGNIVL